MHPLPGSTFWSSLSPAEKVADRTLAIFLAADEMRGVIALAEETSNLLPYLQFAEAVHRLIYTLLPHLNLSRTAEPTRDPELEDVLSKLDAELSRPQHVEGRDWDEWWEQIERDVAPYAIAFYYEIRRMDRLCIRAGSFVVDTREHPA